MSYTVDPIEAKVYMVRVAEQAELYDDMLNFMEPIVVEKAASMTQDDRTLFGVSAKNYIQ
jgi:14-3-3 protein epsilon